MTSRHLTEQERDVIEHLLSSNHPGFEELRKQVDNALVSTLDEFNSIRFDVISYKKANVLDGPLITGSQLDDGIYDDNTIKPHVNVVLFVKDGLLKELQIYKDDGSPIIGSLDPKKMDVIVDPRLLQAPPVKC